MIEIAVGPVGGTVAEVILPARNIFVASHIAPDGDAIGSLLALGWALEKMGKTYQLACPDPVPAVFTFLPGSCRIATQGPDGEEDLIIVLDCSDLGRVASLYNAAVFCRTKIINIDHHVTNVQFGDINWVDTESAATCEMLHRLLPMLQVHLDNQIATCLLNGLVTDTLGFRTPNTTPKVLQAAAELMQHGAPLAEVTERVFQRRSLANVRLWGKIIESLQVEERLVWAANTIAMRQECNAGPGDASGAVTILASVREADAAVLFTENQDGQIEVSMRSRPGVNLAPLALKLGGGGHPQAAGCLLHGPLVEVTERVLTELRHTLDGHRPGFSETEDFQAQRGFRRQLEIGQTEFGTRLEIGD